MPGRPPCSPFFCLSLDEAGILSGPRENLRPELSRPVSFYIFADLKMKIR